MTNVKLNLNLDKEQFDKLADFLAWLKKDQAKKANGK